MSHARIQHDWPEDVLVEETMEGVRYVLPGRMLGGGHVFGAAVVVAGIVIVIAGLWWAAQVVMNGPVQMIHLVPAVAVMLIGAVLWSCGLYMVCGRSELELRGGAPARVRRVERAGLLQWTMRRPIARLSRLRVEIGLTKDKTIDEAITSGVPVQLASLVAEYENGRSARLLVAYPPQWLEAVAHDLADRLAAHPARSQVDTSRPEVVVRDVQSDLRDRSSAGDEPATQPPDSAIEVAWTRDGLTVTIPPLNMWRDQKGAFSIGAAWNGVMATFTGGAFGFGNSSWFVTLAIAGFWGIGTLIMLAAVSIGRRPAIIDVVDDRSGRALLITQRSLFGVKQRGWRFEELRSIECGPSGMEVNEQPVMQLQITPASGGTAAYFTGRDETELRWLARRLREALELPERET